ncbi:MAG: UDP-N-acetylglucosamine--N-acetylmuramyl-(pentapeptide) pyrophosphoryl-undecaprenol N-acetylglucosamine transferase [Patescibacteria group bacterium]
MAFRVLLVGGGSGGHAFPLVAVAQSLRAMGQARGVNAELLLFGQKGFLNTAAREHHIAFKNILAPKFRRYFSLLNLWDLVKAPFALAQSLWHIFWFMPDVVFSKGGYDSVMPVFVAWLYRIPVFVHESDIVPGFANRISAAFARLVFISFAGTARHFPGKTTMLVGNPVRKDLLTGDIVAALEYFKLRPGIRTILVLGGSQGAQEINTIMVASLVMLTNSYQVIHQCGTSQYGVVKSQTDQLIHDGKASFGPGLQDRYRLFSFLDAKELTLAYTLADMVISRAGAGSLSEIAVLGKPAIVVPIAESAGNHQLLNAQEFAKFGGIVVEGANMTPHILINQIQALFEPTRYAAVSQRIREFAKPQAADMIAQTLLDGAHH